MQGQGLLFEFTSRKISPEKKEKTHPYYWQIQCYIFTSSANYCDFAVWTEVDFTTIGVEPDHEFWSSCRLKAKDFVEAVLPQLVAKHFPQQINEQPQASSSSKLLTPPCKGSRRHSGQESFRCVTKTKRGYFHPNQSYQICRENRSLFGATVASVRRKMIRWYVKARSVKLSGFI